MKTTAPEMIAKAAGLKLIAPGVAKLENGKLFPFDPENNNMDCDYAASKIGVEMVYIPAVIDGRPGLSLLGNDEMQATRKNTIDLMLRKIEGDK
jgi:hypothetical protein